MIYCPTVCLMTVCVILLALNHTHCVKLSLRDNKVSLELDLYSLYNQNLSFVISQNKLLSNTFPSGCTTFRVSGSQSFSSEKKRKKLESKSWQNTENTLTFTGFW